MNKDEEQLIIIAAVGLGLYYAHTHGIINLNDVFSKAKGIFGGGGGGGGSGNGNGGGGNGGPSTPAGTVLYDSNNGWSDVETAASGNPQFDAGSDGVGRLSCDAGSHGRVYIGVKNYNAVMQGEFMYESGFSGNDNFSLRLRSRHQEGGDCTNRFGGFGASIHIDGEVGFETESCHNEHENSISGELPFTPEEGKWYGFRYYCVDSADKSSVNFKLEMDDGSGFQTVHTGSHPSPQPNYLDEASFQESSYIWLRMNNASSAAVLAFRNFKVIAQEAGSLDGSTSSLARSPSLSSSKFLYNHKIAGTRW